MYYEYVNQVLVHLFQGADWTDLREHVKEDFGQ